MKRVRQHLATTARSAVPRSADGGRYGTGANSDFLGLGQFTAELVDNDATRSLVRMLPITIEMRDHLRQEKTGNLPSRSRLHHGNSIFRLVHWDSGAPITS